MSWYDISTGFSNPSYGKNDVECNILLQNFLKQVHSSAPHSSPTSPQKQTKTIKKRQAEKKEPPQPPKRKKNCKRKKRDQCKKLPLSSTIIHNQKQK